jgi:hypothetical protein
MENIDYARKGQIVNIKNKFYIYSYEHPNILTCGQREMIITIKTSSPAQL